MLWRSLLLLLPVWCAWVWARWKKTKKRRRRSWHEIPDDILKRGASAQKLQSFGDVDYVIVGSGLGGLTTAALLSRAGWRVLVLEQHDIIGGATHCFEEKGFVWETGLHYVGGNLHQRWSLLGRLFDVVSDGALEWSKCDHTFDYAVDLRSGKTLAFGPSRTANFKMIATVFGCDYDALNAYGRACDLAKLAGVLLFALKMLPPVLSRIFANATRRLHRWAWGRSVDSVLAKCKVNEDVIGALTYLYGDYGVLPGEAPFALHAIVATHYEGGAYFPRGGAKSIAKCIVAALPTHAACFARAPVTEIKQEGVVCKGVFIHARRGIISNAGVVKTRELAGLKPLAYNTPSVAVFYVFVGLRGSSQDLGLPAANIWFLDGWRHDQSWRNFGHPEANPPVCFMSCCSAKDNPNGKATLQLLVPVKYEWFERWQHTKLQHRGREYEQLKSNLQKRILETFLFARYPKTRDQIEHCVVASPLTTNWYFNADRGATYGLHHGLPRFDLDFQLEHLHTQVGPRLYLVGQDHMCVGIASALLSGFISTAYLDKRAIGIALFDALLYAGTFH